MMAISTTAIAKASWCCLIRCTRREPALVEAFSSAVLSSVAAWNRSAGDFARHLKTIAFRAGGALSVGCVSALMTGSGAVFAITRWGSKDGWRLNPSGPQESANEQRETLSAGGTTPLKPKQGLNGPPVHSPIKRSKRRFRLRYADQEDLVAEIPLDWLGA